MRSTSPRSSRASSTHGVVPASVGATVCSQPSPAAPAGPDATSRAAPREPPTGCPGVTGAPLRVRTRSRPPRQAQPVVIGRRASDGGDRRDRIVSQRALRGRLDPARRSRWSNPPASRMRRPGRATSSVAPARDQGRPQRTLTIDRARRSSAAEPSYGSGALASVTKAGSVKVKKSVHALRRAVRLLGRLRAGRGGSTSAAQRSVMATQSAREANR
jgi:hypothetical protein